MPNLAADARNSLVDSSLFLPHALCSRRTGRDSSVTSARYASSAEPPSSTPVLTSCSIVFMPTPLPPMRIAYIAVAFMRTLSPLVSISCGEVPADASSPSSVTVSGTWYRKMSFGCPWGSKKSLICAYVDLDLRGRPRHGRSAAGGGGGGTAERAPGPAGRAPGPGART